MNFLWIIVFLRLCRENSKQKKEREELKKGVTGRRPRNPTVVRPIREKIEMTYNKILLKMLIAGVCFIPTEYNNNRVTIHN